MGCGPPHNNARGAVATQRWQAGALLAWRVPAERCKAVQGPSAKRQGPQS